MPSSTINTKRKRSKAGKPKARRVDPLDSTVGTGAGSSDPGSRVPGRVDTLASAIASALESETDQAVRDWLKRLAADPYKGPIARQRKRGRA